MQHGQNKGTTARWTSVVAVMGIAIVASPVPAYAEDEGEKLCDVGDQRLGELSGLVATDDGYFAIGDGTAGQNQLDIIGLDSDCQHTDTGVTADIDPADPEDLAMDDDGVFWVADIGDNQQQRDTVALHRVNLEDGEGTTYRFTYPDGEKYNAEALLLQPDGTPIFATWEPGKTQLFAPEGDLSADAEIPLESKGELKIEATETEGGPESVGGIPLDDAPSTIVTGGAVSPDGDKAVLRTYTDAYEFEVSDGDVAKAVTDSDPAITPLPGEPQGEAIGYDPDGEKFVTGSEAEIDEAGETVNGPQMWTYTPAKGSGSDSEEDEEEDDSGPGLARSILTSLGANGILWIVAGIGAIGLIMIIIGARAIIRARRRNANGDDESDIDPGDHPDDEPPSGYRGTPYEQRSGDGLGDGELFEPARGDRDLDNRRGYEGRSGNIYGSDSRGDSVYGGHDEPRSGRVYGGDEGRQGMIYGGDEGRSGRIYGGRDDDEGRSGNIYGGRQ